MIKTILSVTAALTLAVPALASGDVVGNGDKLRSQDPKVKFYTPEATGCMICLLYTSPSPRDATLSRMPSSA